MSNGVDRFTNLRAWQACDTYKKAVYRLCLESPLSRDWKRRDQLEEAVAGPPGHLSEGFGRFSPPDFARFTVIARSSLMESQNHLRDAVDKNYITEETRLQLDALAEIALKEVTEPNLNLNTNREPRTQKGELEQLTPVPPSPQ